MKTSLKLWDELITTEPDNKLVALNNLVAALWSEGYQAEAIAAELELRDLLNSAGNASDWLDTSWQVGLKYHIIGEHNQAIEIVNETLPQASVFGSNHNYAFLNLLKGHAQSELGLHEDAIGSLTRAAEAFSDYENTEMNADAVFTRASLHAKLSSSVAATEDYREALRLFELAGKADQVLDASLEYGEFLFHNSEYVQCRALLNDALSMARFLKDVDSEQKTLRLLGECHSFMNDSAIATSLFKRAIALRGNPVQQQESARAMLSLSKHNHRIGEKALSSRQRREVIPLLRALGLSNLIDEEECSAM